MAKSLSSHLFVPSMELKTLITSKPKRNKRRGGGGGGGGRSGETNHIFYKNNTPRRCSPFP